jgi:hypothetical protein
MPKAHWSRRELIKRFGMAAALLSPILRVTRAYAADTTIRKRYVGLFKPIGFIPADFWPTALTLSRTDEWSNLILGPLEPHKADLTLIRGLEYRRPPGNAHAQGTARVFTGATVDIPPSGDAVDYGFPNDISIDQAIAAYLRTTGGVTTPFRSLEFAVRPRSNLLIGRMSFDAPKQALQPTDDPAVMYDRLLAKIADVCGGGGANTTANARELSLLEATRGDLNDAKARLGLNGEERQKLERYQAAIEEIELGLKSIVPITRACPTTTRPTVANTNGNYDKLSALQRQLMLLALDWDLTRVCTLMWSGAQSNQAFDFLKDANGNSLGTLSHHTLTHEVRDSIGDNPRAKLKIIDTWYMKELAALLQGMKAIDDGGGKTLLDNAIVLLGTEVADGATHRHDNMPFIMAGRAAGALTSGNFHQLPAMRSHNDLLLTIGQAMGMPITTFGEASKCSGPMAMLKP